MIYRREEQAKRVARLFSCAVLSGAFGSLLAYGWRGWLCGVEVRGPNPRTTLCQLLTL
jgi:hypothetical protein